MRFNPLWAVLPLLLSLTQQVKAEERWLKIADNSNSTIFLDTKYLSIEKGFASAQAIEKLNTVASDGTVQELTKYRFLCKRRLGTIQSVIKIGADNKIIDYIVNQEPNKLTKVVEKTVAGAVFNYACANSNS
ncbi:MAG TPA: hypothetical protein VE956_03485 [Nodularia sp. (in: cyanobacteria)]|nr:hypothetical protein [Nodularia sp. (in: cyanobacteria)]